MNNITYAVSVDVNNPIIPYNVYVASVLDSNVRYLEITLYQNGNVIALSNTATATASLVTDNVLVDDSVECTISNNIISVPLEDLQRHGNLDVQVTVTEGTKVLAIPFPIQVRVTPNIAENAQIDNDSLGSYAEVVREIAAARGDYPDLKDRLDGEIDRIDDDISDINTALLGKANKAAAGSAGELAALDGNGSPIRSGVSVIQSIGEGSNSRVPTTAAVKTALDGKADKAAAGTDGELAALDDNGALKRSGVTVAQSVGEGSADKVPTTEAVRNALNDAEDTIAENIDWIFQGNSAFFPQLYFEQYFTANGSNYRLIYDDRDGERHVLFDFAQLPAATGESDTNADIADLKAYIGYTDGDILGLHADFENKVFTRLGAAVGLTAGQDFNAFPMYGERRRCNVANDGTINAYYGDADYVEDGTNGQVMVYQPAFYYKVVPLELEKNTQSNIGYHLRKANYYVSSKYVFGFKRHPLFYDEQGNPVDYVLLSAYEGSMYDVSEEAYVNDSVDTSVSYGAGDLLCSVAGKKPISGKLGGIGSKALFETMANNIGPGWHLNTIKAESANQLLMLIELGRFNTQAAIGQGVVSQSGADNASSLTGSTANLGNGTGQATETIAESAGTETVNTTSGKLSISYRGVENPWGNIWKHTNGINLWGDGHMGGGQVFICDDFSFNESKHDGNYQSAGFTVSDGGGYVSAFGYGDEDYDWLFMPSETTGNSSLPVGDNFWCTSNLNGYRIARLGGGWDSGANAGGFFWACNSTPNSRHFVIGGRLLYVPTATGFGPQGPAGSNYALTAADRQAIAQIAMDGLNGNGVAY